MKLVVYDSAWGPLAPQLRESLEAEWDVVCGADDLDWLQRELPTADALLALRLPCQARGCAQRLRLFLFPGAGVMHTHPSELPAGCNLCNVYEHEIPVSEYVLMVVLMHLIEVERHLASFRRGRWEGNGRIGGVPHSEAYGRTLGLIGYGHIGQAVAARAKAFGMRVIAVRKNSASPPSGTAPDELFGPDGLPAVLAQSDFVVLACPLTDSTRGLIGPRELEQMRGSAMLINVARAELVEEEALYAALKDRRIAAAALDVWYQYPSTNDQFLHGSTFPFHELPNVVVTPHLSAWTGAMLARRGRAMAANLNRLAAGKPLERVILVGNGSLETH